MVSCLPFDGSYADASGSGVNGVFAGMTPTKQAFQGGMIGSAAYVTNLGYISLGGQAVGAQDFTVSMWVARALVRTHTGTVTNTRTDTDKHTQHTHTHAHTHLLAVDEQLEGLGDVELARDVADTVVGVPVCVCVCVCVCV